MEDMRDNLPVSWPGEKALTEVIAVYLDAIGRFQAAEEVEEVPNLTFIKSKWDLGDFLVFDHTNTKRILRIGYLDAMKHLKYMMAAIILSQK